MTVNYEIKGMLAKLLATEDIIIEHRNVETASFNVHTRVLTLPMWKKASDSVYTMLVLHESAHGIYTNDIDWTQTHKIPPSIVNICEDVRVEKLMKRRYPGSPKSFYSGYKELHEQDFFSIADDDISTYNLGDRVNLHFKIGNFLSIDFTPEEQEIVDLIGATETFDEVLHASEVLYKYCKQEQEETKISIDSLESKSFGDGGQLASDFTDQEPGENDQQESSQTESNEGDKEEGGDNQQESSQTESNQSDDSSDEPEIKTVSALEESIKELISNGFNESVYVEIPELDLDKVIVPNKEIHEGCKICWDEFMNHPDYSYEEIFSRVDQEFLKFKRSALNEVNYLVKEFECRKSADSYARATTARTGVLDCSKLHTYKFRDDLFKKITVLSEGKNHGLVFILDWSGSMGNVMVDTVKQLFNLMWFCKKVSIPFEVYAFTSSYPIVKKVDGKTVPRGRSYIKKENLLCVDDYFSLMNLFTSRCKTHELETQMKNIFRLAHTHGHHRFYIKYPIPIGMDLSGTPLNETMIALHQILPKFKRDNKLQKVQCVILTDGEGQDLKYHKEIRRGDNDAFIGTNSIYRGTGSSFLRDRKTGHVYSLGQNYWKITDVLLHNLRDKFMDMNFIGIRILESGSAHSFIRRYVDEYNSQESLINSWKKERSFVIKSSGYHSYFAMTSNSLSQNTTFEVADGATKSQIKSSFVKSLKSKKMNKKILNEFIQLVV